jgi:TonB family protein
VPIAQLFLSMSCKLTLLAMAITMISQHTGFAATDIKERDSEPRAISEEEALRLAIFTPAPRYPYEARASHITGKGVVRLEVNTRTGYVTSARMLQSTGHQILDDEALKAFQMWRFKPGTVSAVRIPVTFDMPSLRGLHEYVRVFGHSLWLHNATYWFMPEYPRAARAKGLTGKGVALAKVDPQSGYVISASMLKSTGHESLDSAALLAFRQWRFKPRTVTTVEIPIQFTTKGVFY